MMDLLQVNMSASFAFSDSYLESTQDLFCLFCHVLKRLQVSPATKLLLSKCIKDTNGCNFFSKSNVFVKPL